MGLDQDSETEKGDELNRLKKGRVVAEESIYQKLVRKDLGRF